MSLPEILAAGGTGLILLGAAGIYAILRWLRRTDDAGVWTAAELGQLHTPTRGRHRLAGQRAADHIGRPGWTPRHDEDEVPPNIRTVTMGLPVVQRAPVPGVDAGTQPATSRHPGSADAPRAAGTGAQAASGRDANRLADGGGGVMRVLDTPYGAIMVWRRGIWKPWRWRYTAKRDGETLHTVEGSAWTRSGAIDLALYFRGVRESWRWPL